MEYKDFLHMDYKPDKDDLVCLFRIEPAEEFSFEEASARVASESSTGTWAALKVPDHLLKKSGKVFSVEPPYVKIAYPLVLFEKGSIPQVISSIAGNIFGMKAVDNIRLEDIAWPKPLIKSFRGPQFGIKGVRKILKNEKRLPLACVPKPKIGLTTDEFCKIAEDAWSGGVDLLKDDENLADQSFNRFEDRLKRCMKLRDTIEKDTGDKKSYLINITAETREMLRRAKLVKDSGNEYVMIDILTIGWAAVQTVRDECQDLGLAIHAHRAFHAAFDRNPKHGMSMKVIASIARLQGVDQLHIGGLGKLAGDEKEVKDNWTKTSAPKNDEYEEVLAQDWHGMTPVLPVCSGGLHAGIVPRLVDLLGKDIAVQAGGGIHGHPGGTHAGAIGMRAVLEAIADDIPIQEAAEKCPELKVALDKWGTWTPK